jgi:hypothetical protein
MSMRHEWEGGDDGSSSQKGTLKGMFKKQKKSKQIELDALRYADVTAYHFIWQGHWGAVAASLYGRQGLLRSH